MRVYQSQIKGSAARELRQPVPRLAEAAGQVLRAIGVPADAIDRELAAMCDAMICTTASRRVLGSMTDFAFLMKAWADRNLCDDGSLVALAVRLAAAPCSPLGGGRPRDAAMAALMGREIASLE